MQEVKKKKSHKNRKLKAIPTNDVELETHEESFCSYIDVAKTRDYIMTVLIIIISYVFIVLSAFNTPPALVSNSKYYSIANKENDSIINLNGGINPSKPFQSDVKIECVLCSKMNQLQPRELKINVFPIFENLDESISHEILSPAGRFNFNGNLKESDPIILYQNSIHGINNLKARVVLQGDFTELDGVKIIYTFKDSVSYDFIQYCRYFVSGMVGYAFIFYIANCYGKDVTYPEVICILLGIFGSLTFNPSKYAFDESYVIEVSDYLFGAIFQNVLRWVFVSNLLSFKIKNQSDLIKKLTGFGLVYYALVDFLAKCFANMSITFQIGFEFYYICIVMNYVLHFGFLYLLYQLYRITQSSITEESSRKFRWLIICGIVFQLASIVFTTVYHLGFQEKRRTVVEILIDTLGGIFATTTLYFLRRYESNTYEPIKSEGKPQDIGIEVLPDTPTQGTELVETNDLIPEVLTDDHVEEVNTEEV